MAFQRFSDKSSYVTFDFDYEGQRLLVHTGDIPMLHADHDTNTFIIDRTQLNDEGFYSIRDDLLRIDGVPVPNGQFCFLIYDGDGDFLSWSNSADCNTGTVCVGLKSFGYTASVTNPISYHVDDKSIFTLKLKFGY